MFTPGGLMVPNSFLTLFSMTRFSFNPDHQSGSSVFWERSGAAIKTRRSSSWCLCEVEGATAARPTGPECSVTGVRTGSSTRDQDVRHGSDPSWSRNQATPLCRVRKNQHPAGLVQGLLQGRVHQNCFCC